MRKTLLTASLLLLSATLSFGQKALVDQAWSLAKKSEKPDFKTARATIKQALEGESAEDVKAWYVAGDIEQRYYEKENGQIQLNSHNFNLTLQKIQICDFEDKTKSARFNKKARSILYCK